MSLLDTLSRWKIECAQLAREVSGSVKRLGTAIASAIILMSCHSEGHQNPLTFTLTDGSEITYLLVEESCSVVLVMSPQECLSCDGILETWVGLGRRSQFELHLLLTSAPSAKQLETLKLQRVPLRGVIAEGPAISEATAYLFAGDVAVDSIVGLTQQSLVLSQFAMTLRGHDPALDQACLWKSIEREDVSR